MRPPGTGEFLLILILCVVVFGASKVNPLGDALGRFWRNLKHGARNDDRIAVKPDDDDAPKA
jgi:Sec-independent protein translocase protein TatA